jgi:DNA-binding MarR family transcriptional regulator
MQPLQGKQMAQAIYSRMSSELKPAELRAWRAFLDAQSRLMRQLEADLVAADGMTLAEFDVLIQLGLAPDSRLRMTELADRVRLSPSGITRLVDRLARAGLVKRTRCASDRRGTWAMLTAGGRRRLDRVAPVHLRSIREHFARRLTPAQLSSLAVTLEELA